MSKVAFLRVGDMTAVIKPHHQEVQELLAQARLKMAEVDALEEAHLELLKSDTSAMKERGFQNYYNSAEREAHLEAVKENLDQRVVLLAESKKLRERARGMLDWIKETFE